MEIKAAPNASAHLRIFGASMDLPYAAGARERPVFYFARPYASIGESLPPGPWLMPWQN